MLSDLRLPEPFLTVFPDPKEVFVEPVDRYFRNLLPLVSIDLSAIEPTWSGRVHVVMPTELIDGYTGANTAAYHSYYTCENWIGFRLDGHNRYELIGDLRYFELEGGQVDPDQVEHAERCRAAYVAGKQRFKAYNRLYHFSCRDKAPRTDRAYAIVDQLGGTAGQGNWQNGRQKLKLDDEDPNDAVPLTLSGRRFRFIANVSPYNYAQDDGSSKFMDFGSDGILLFYDHEERIALLTFEYT